MPQDVQTLREWLLVVLIISAACSTSLPIVYSFTGWRKFKTGRLFMLLSISFAMAMDAKVLFSFWKTPNVIFLFCVALGIFTLIAGASVALVILVVKMNYLK